MAEAGRPSASPAGRSGGGMRALGAALRCLLLLAAVRGRPAPALPGDGAPQPADDLRSETGFLEELVVGSGDTVELQCNTPDSPVSLLWYKDGVGISPTNRTHIGPKLLRIINVSYNDSGRYSCKKRHSVEMLRNFTVRVTESPSSGDDEDDDDDEEDDDSEDRGSRSTGRLLSESIGCVVLHSQPQMAFRVIFAIGPETDCPDVSAWSALCPAGKTNLPGFVLIVGMKPGIG